MTEEQKKEIENMLNKYSRRKAFAEEEEDKEWMRNKQIVEYTYKNIIIDPTSDRAKKAVGKQVYYSQFPNICLLRANNDDRVLQGILISIDTKNSLGSFIVDGTPYACIIVKKKSLPRNKEKKYGKHLHK